MIILVMFVLSMLPLDVYSEKIEDTPSRPEYILTRRGVGYYMRNND